MKQSMARLKLCFENSEVSTLHGYVVRPYSLKNVIFARVLHGCGNSSASAKLPRHPFLLLAASTLPNPGIDTKSSRGGKGQLWILKTNSWCLSCCQVTSDLFSLITSVHTQQLTGQHGESRMGPTVNRKRAASRPIQLPERFYENWRSKVGGPNKAFTVHKVKLLFECGFKLEHQRSRNKLNHLYHFLQIVNSASFDQFEAWRKILSSRSQAATQSQTSRPALSSPSPPLSEPGRAEELSPLRCDRCGGSGERRTTCESLEPNRCDQYWINTIFWKLNHPIHFESHFDSLQTDISVGQKEGRTPNGFGTRRISLAYTAPEPDALPPGVLWRDLSTRRHCRLRFSMIAAAKAWPPRHRHGQPDGPGGSENPIRRPREQPPDHLEIQRAMLSE